MYIKTKEALRNLLVDFAKSGEIPVGLAAYETKYIIFEDQPQLGVLVVSNTNGIRTYKWIDVETRRL